MVAECRRAAAASTEFPEVDRAEWFEPERARGKILPAQEELIDRLLEHSAGSRGYREPGRILAAAWKTALLRRLRTAGEV